jgi:hypothetical protein
MPITDQPTFSSGDVPTATQLNDWMTSITNAFTSMVAGDFQWPMKAAGDLDLDGNDILKTPAFNGVYNLSLRRPWATAQHVFDEVAALGGGAILLPGNTTQASTILQEDVDGIKVGSNTLFFGRGNSSIMGSLRAEDKVNITVRDMQLNDNNRFQRIDGLTFERCNFTATSGDQLRLDGCTNVNLIDCRFEGGNSTAYQLRVEGVDELDVTGCQFNDFGDAACYLVRPTNGALNNIRIMYNIITHPSAYAGSLNYAIYLLRSGDSGRRSDELTEDIKIRGNVIADKPGGVYGNSVDGLRVRSNVLLDSTTSTTMIGTQGSRDYQIVGNVISSAVDIGIYTDFLIGSSISYNCVVSADAGLVVEMPDDTGFPAGAVNGPTMPSASAPSVVVGNLVRGADAALPSAALWGLKLDPTVMLFHHNWIGNHFSTTDGSNDGRHCFLGTPGTQGGQIGTKGYGFITPGYYFIYSGNTSPGLQLTTTNNVGDDIRSNAPLAKVIAENNNI